MEFSGFMFISVIKVGCGHIQRNEIQMSDATKDIHIKTCL